MKFRFLYSLFACGLCLVLLMGNKIGRATQSGIGNTGAPGDATNSNGTPRTCSYCHTGPSISAAVSIAVLDSTGTPVVAYLPGKKYIARVTIDATGANVNGYGFQMIALRDLGNVDLDGFSDTIGNNYKLATISNGRTYAEHNNVSAIDTFNVRWTAPPAGTGQVSFYAAGNGVNNDGFSGNKDGSGNTKLTLTEQLVSSAHNPMRLSLQARVWPNPLSEKSQLVLNSARSGEATVRVFNVSGKMELESTAYVQAGENRMPLEMPQADAGLYWIYLALPDGQNQVIKAAKF